MFNPYVISLVFSLMGESKGNTLFLAPCKGIYFVISTPLLLYRLIVIQAIEFSVSETVLVLLRSGGFQDCHHCANAEILRLCVRRNQFFRDQPLIFIHLFPCAAAIMNR